MAGYGIAGAHRSGKTTLARAVSVQHGLEYLDANVSGTIAELGYTPRQELPFKERLKVQNAILESLAIKYALMGDKEFVTDRTPMDVLGYTFSEVQRSTLDAEDRVAFTKHVERAIQVTAQNLKGVMLVQPVYDAPELDKSAQACPIYMRHVYICVRDMVEQLSPVLFGATLVGQSIEMELEARKADFGQLVDTLQQLQGGPKVWMPNP